MKLNVRQIEQLGSYALTAIETYVLTAFPLWKCGCFFINGIRGLSDSFSAYAWSRAAGEVYLVSSLVLFISSGLQISRKNYRVVGRTLFFLALAVVFYAIGEGFSVEALRQWPGIILSALTLGTAIVGLYHFKTRVFLYWVWSYSITLVIDVGLLWNPQVFMESSEFVFIIQLVARALLVSSIILLVRQMRAQYFEFPPVNTARNVALIVFILLIAVYPSLRYLDSAAFLPFGLAIGVMLLLCAHSWFRFRLIGFALWAMASAGSIALMIIDQMHREITFPPRVIDQIIRSINVNASAVISLVWLLGMIVLVRHLWLTMAPEGRQVPVS